MKNQSQKRRVKYEAQMKGEICIQNISHKVWRLETAWETRWKWEENIKMDLKNMGWGCGLESTGSVKNSVVHSYECSNETFGSTIGREFLHQLSNCQASRTILFHEVSYTFLNRKSTVNILTFQSIWTWIPSTFKEQKRVKTWGTNISHESKKKRMMWLNNK